MASTQVRGVISLSIDHGNIAGASPLDLLDEIMYRLNFQINEGNYCKSWRANHRREVQPHDIFDIIAGSGTGGLLAAMLSTMQMDLKTARAEYIRLSEQLFPNLFGQVFNEYSASVATQKFEASLQRLITKYHPARASNAHIINPSARSKTLILANKKESLRAERPALFRTYNGGRNMIDCRLWQALRATTTDLRAGTFQAVDINREKYCGTSIANGNPTASLTEELDTGISVDLILSLGCGHPDTISLPPGTSTNTYKTLRTNDAYGAGPYHRLNVQQGMQKMEGKHFDPSTYGEVVTHSKQYMESPEVSRKIDNIVAILLERMVQMDLKLQRGPHSELPTTFHYQSRIRQNVNPKPSLGAAVDLKGRKRLLALDGGGIVGISEMLLLQSILGDRRPCDYFHLIGGSGTGGIFAILLGRYQMKISDAISVFEKCTFRVAKYLKNNTSATTIDTNTLTNMLQQDLENVMTSLSFSGEGVPMLRPSWELACRSFVLVNALDNMNASRPRLFRTYAPRASVEIPIPVIQAMRATTAGRSLFHDVTIGSEFLSERFGGTTYANNNPTYHLVEEAKLDTIALPSSMTRATTAYFDVLKQISANCEGTHYEMARDLNPNLYHRFNVPSGLSNKSKDSWSLMDMKGVQTSTINYIETPAVGQSISRVIAALENAELEERFSKLKTSKSPTTSSYYPQPISHTSSMPNANLLGLPRMAEPNRAQTLPSIPQIAYQNLPQASGIAGHAANATRGPVSAKNSGRKFTR
ncbi:hypothetical protein DL96DRAFT_1820979 [Flagelloscypha sp. PMI_526]|nr:hypothetical protein DL96DRAFT_1820979 [Flagelloscypha sp. PMI_526]